MSKYKLSTGLRTVRENPEFDTDSEAWEYLRKILPDAYATLYKEVEFSVPYNNAEEYVNNYNSVWGPPPIGRGREGNKLLIADQPRISYEWIPVLEGITSHPYNI